MGTVTARPARVGVMTTMTTMSTTVDELGARGEPRVSAQGSGRTGPRTRSERVLGLLRLALGAELFALARTKRCYYAAIEAKELHCGEVLLEQAVVQAVQADQLVERITELGGAPDFSAQALGAGEASRVDVTDVREVLALEIVRRTRGLEHQRALVAAIGDDDTRARLILEGIVTREEEQTRNLARLLD